MTVGRNTIAGEMLQSFIESIERLQVEKKELGQEITAKFAEAKAQGFNVTVMRNIIKRRTAKPHDLQEHDALMDLYQNALGMISDAPLFRAVGLVAEDELAREVVIDRMKAMVPPDGEIIVKIGKPVRIFRVKDGEPQVEDFVERVPKEPKSAGAPMPTRVKPEVPNCNADQAEVMGGQAARDNIPIINNPFPFGDERRPRWDLGWRKENGGDGMGDD